MLDKSTVISLVEQYAQAVTKEFTPESVMLYGSYAKGNAHDESDIDVAVIFNEFEGDWLESSANLWRLTEDISFYIEPVLLDRAQDKSGFVKNILKTGRVIYQARA